MSRTSLNLLFYNRTFVKTLALLAIVTFALLTSPHSAFAQDPTPVADAPVASGGVGGFLAALGVLAKGLIDFVVGLGGLVMAISVALGGFSGQVSSAMGMPYAQASAGQRIVVAIGLFALTASTTVIANLAIDQIGKLVQGSGAIHFISN